jgi:hypothetical protein
MGSEAEMMASGAEGSACHSALEAKVHIRKFRKPFSLVHRKVRLQSTFKGVKCMDLLQSSFH